MWIRSKGKDVLVHCENIEVDGSSVYGSHYFLGEYETEQRALEVLDMIEDRIMQGNRFDEIQNGKRKTRDFVFQMPDK
ncbi:hypothetical protein G8E05_06315 [Clostridium botulinum]|uniref:Uncharacterized protein n=1 Tax=Clostridium botulinum (strain 657 / Type Ba4) TaxID=515621 RepID=A0A3F2ZUW7_CLOB6|nr:hypothetical protein [Clostridium botulinum]AJD25586.1 hypothetical protein T257_3110 [Clostridium botulinum CDC_297]EPS50165.1 hypothetical protein CFSAN002368_14938 [Clostridium botulinum A1 str. CFSAN002368]ACQ52920.1 hypothetical protein CLJ_B2562 [Clostridium botulinum Ba4 str. 657]APU61231.1 hypothetical protein NPD8_3190 [Clostridium botulinum]AXG94048.1 hypothetical protein AGE29_20860 [Clostridium botulinum]